MAFAIRICTIKTLEHDSILFVCRSNLFRHLSTQRDHVEFKCENARTHIHEEKFYSHFIQIIMHFNGWEFSMQAFARHALSFSPCVWYIEMLQTQFLFFGVSLQRKSRVKAAHTHVVSCTFRNTPARTSCWKRAKNIHHVIPHWIIALAPDWLRLVCAQNCACLFAFFLSSVHLNVFALMMMENRVSNASTMFLACLARFFPRVYAAMSMRVFRQCYVFFIRHFSTKYLYTTFTENEKGKEKNEDVRPSLHDVINCL